MSTFFREATIATGSTRDTVDRRTVLNKSGWVSGYWWKVSDSTKAWTSMAPDFAWAFCQIILRFEKRCWQYIDNFFYLFICLFVCPPKTVNLCDLCTSLELGSLTQLEEARDPYAHLSGLPNLTNLHLFKRSKTFWSFDSKNSVVLKLGYYAPPPAHPEGSAAAARNEAHWSAHVTYIVLYIYNML